MKANYSEGASWFVGGMTGERYRVFNGKRFNPPATVSWLTIDAATGQLSGNPRSVGKFPVIVSCMSPPLQGSKDPTNGDAVLLVIDVTR